MFHFYTPWKPKVFWRFQGGIEMEPWAKIRSTYYGAIIAE